ncbi:MAG TPA: hypothetical protein VGY48_15805 [Vicinamibacterales bacterium]|jgi:hypothetical protein|nr:hypothetical protein [Vicinamibacterales bacterium]
MKTRNLSPKTRPVAALLTITATLFLLAGRSCGVVGALLSASVERLVGAAGTGLLVSTAWCIAFILATPPGTLTRMVVAVWRAVKPRHRPSVVVVKTRPVELPMLSDAAVQAASKEAAVLIANRLDEQKTLAPRDRQTLDAVRSALKNLDFNKNEYEPLVARMDPSLGFEKLVKSALKTLREVN